MTTERIERKEASEIERSERHLLEREGRSQRGRHSSTEIERQRGREAVSIRTHPVQRALYTLILECSVHCTH